MLKVHNMCNVCVCVVWVMCVCTYVCVVRCARDLLFLFVHSM